MKKRFCKAAALFAAVVVCACGVMFGSSARELDTTLNIALSGEPTNLDLVTNTADVAGSVARGSIFEQLVNLDADGNVVCELAESYERSEDGTVYTYYLRQGVLFHNGEEMKAADVVASLNRWIELADSAKNLVGDARFTEVDDYTVQITLETGTAYLNEVMAGLSQHSIITPASVIEAIDETGVLSEYIGTGPYMYEDWKADQYIKLVKNPDYQPYGEEGDFSGEAGYKSATYEEVYFYFPGDNTTIANGMGTEFDATAALEPDDLLQFEGNEDFTIFSEQAEMALLIFNKSEGWGANQTIRQAVQALVNCDDVLYAATGSEEYYSLYSSYMFDNQLTWYTENGSEYYNQNDPEKAAALFEEAGWTEDDTFRILVANDSPDFMVMAQVVQEELRSIGINAEVLSYDWSTFADIRNNRPSEYEAFITSFSPKVLPSMNLFLSSSWAGWCSDERVQSDLTAIITETDASAAQQIWYDLQQYMYEEYVPVVKFGNTTTLALSTSKLTGCGLKEGGLVWVNSKLEQ